MQVRFWLPRCALRQNTTHSLRSSCLNLRGFHPSTPRLNHYAKYQRTARSARNDPPHPNRKEHPNRRSRSSRTNYSRTNQKTLLWQADRHRHRCRYHSRTSENRRTAKTYLQPERSESSSSRHRTPNHPKRT